MNYLIIFRLLSMMMWVFAFAFGICAGVSHIYSDVAIEANAMSSWICVIALTLLLGFTLYLPSRNAPTKIYKKEAMCTVGITWLICSILGALPYVLILNCSFADAFFESASGLTTTGSSVFGDFSEIPASLLFWRAMSQWIGGLGVVIFFVAILSFIGAGGKTLYSNESSSVSTSMGHERIQKSMYTVFALYIAISFLCALILKISGMNYYDAICHTFATVSTGGFSTHEESIAYYNSALIEWVITFFMFLCGISFAVIITFVRGNLRTIRQNVELWAYIAITIVATLLISIFLIDSSEISILQSIRLSAFQVVSIMTTTGFATADYQIWIPITHSILFILMIIGGCAGSTSGGLKVVRIVGAFKICLRSAEKSFRPNIVRPIKLNGKTLDSDSSEAILTYIVLYLLIALVSVLIFATIESDLSFAGAFSSIFSFLSNIGPGLNEVGPSKNYAFLNDTSKIFASIIMIMGRLEIYAILVLFMPSLWKKFN